MHETVVFLETSLAYQEAMHLLPHATYLSSIKKGDVLKAIKAGYKRIVIIDGNFSWVPSVWHKEILTALDYGIEVWGAASMGALRAAELDSFGMRGHGRIYEMYKNEEIDGDDEVAIAYSKFNNLQTIPLINIRLTLELLNITNKKEVLNSLRSIFYAERTWEKVAQHVPVGLYDLIKSNYMDVKKEDAKSLLFFLSQQNTPSLVFDLDTKKREFTLFEKKLIECTLSPIWANLVHGDQEAGEVEQQRAENILKLLSISETKKNTLHYQHLLSLLDEQTYTITEYELIYQVEQFREEYNLLKGEDFFNWLKDRELHDSNLEQVFTDYVKLTKHLLINYDFNRYFN
ncbi:TPA: TfuA-like protein [Legionella pneumophila]|uniref:TfuA-like protein n=1 Tax=Legionella pneumophila TaxID=446 RepID=UPI000777F1A3|nr:TfuA-like protein [Legionella pneumophila]HAU0829401.1 TfuA-like protein [Legionella pneumophila]HBD7058816.1 TfuA-like protein [Legionella pneumophila]HCQ3574151.1 TfuA-like protein [Legionella pneumophila]HEM7041310.1 TfuA-like protein [Legionella pneumophila]HEO1426256.1 TfuA-like protein [Legionella pneumophila]